MAAVKTENVLKVSIIVCLGLLAWLVSGAYREHVVVAGDSAPGFTITTDDGRTISPEKFGGKLLVVHFWATWCPPCVTEMPSLSEFQKEFASSGVVVLGISVDQNARAYHNFLERQKVSFATARDPDAKIASDYGTYQYPETYIIGRNGTVIEKVVSNADWMDPERQNLIRSMLGS